MFLAPVSILRLKIKASLMARSVCFGIGNKLTHPKTTTCSRYLLFLLAGLEEILDLFVFKSRI